MSMPQSRHKTLSLALDFAKTGLPYWRPMVIVEHVRTNKRHQTTLTDPVFLA